MAKYDAAGDRIERRFPIFPVVLMAAGAVLLTAGIIVCKNTDMSKYESQMQKGITIDQNYDGSSVKNIDLEYGYGDLTVDKSSDGNIYVKGENVPDYYTIGLNGNTFEIKSRKNHFNLWDIGTWGFGLWNNNDVSLTVYLPKKIYDEVSIDSGAGEVILNGLSCNEFDIDSGAGDCTVTSMSCNDFSVDLGAGDCDIISSTIEGIVEADAGAGNLTMQNCSAGGLDIDLGAGDFEFYGSVNGNINIDSGAGDCTIDLYGDESDYRFVGDRKNRYGSRDGKYIVDIDSGVGDIDFTFGNTKE